LSTPFRLRIPEAIVRQMVEHAVAESPNECCGILGGKFEGLRNADHGAAGCPLAKVDRCFRLINEAASPVEFLSEARSLFQAMRELRDLHLEMLAIYHSHPASDPIPSVKDRQRNYSDDVANLIVSLNGPKPLIRAWWLTKSSQTEAEWDCVPN
jgi:[CysO sulfur-carrier protein]-S-L-cysteine hydrolase